ncbi:class I SAM-dependent methyltransferase [bacterium]|nr:class I SAM-dependent methyltransferase [bacterium]
MSKLKQDHRIGLEDYIGRMNLEGGRGIYRGNRPKIDHIIQQVRPFMHPGMKVAEFGLGEGYLIRRMFDSHMEVTGLDLSGYLIERLGELTKQEGRSISFIQADIADTKGYTIEGQDAFFCLDILEHISEEEYAQALKNIHAALKPGGLFIGTVPNEENLAKSMVSCPNCGHEFHRIGHKQRFDKTKLVASLQQHFTVRKVGLVAPLHKSDIGRRLKKLARHPFKRFAPGDTLYFVAVKK